VIHRADWNRFHAADYGQLVARYIALAIAHGHDDDLALAIAFARKAAHFGGACLASWSPGRGLPVAA
jgi:hypothetical protein